LVFQGDFFCLAFKAKKLGVKILNEKEFFKLLE